MPGKPTMALVMTATMLVAGVLAEDVNCKVSDYRSGAEFDLTELENQIVQTTGHGSATSTLYDYTIFPCGKKLEYKEVCEFPYACQHKAGDGPPQSKMLGSKVFRDQLQPLVTGDGSVPLGAKLMMVDGSKCNNNGEPMDRSLEVNYFCSDKEMTVLNEDFHCSYVMYVYSKRACPKMPKKAQPSTNRCSVTHDDITYNISPLKKLTGNHVIFARDVIDKPITGESTEYEFIINVCQNINTNKDLAHDSANQNCHLQDGNAGICQVYYDNASPFKPHYRLVGKTVTNAGNQELQYDATTQKLFLRYELGTPYVHGDLEKKLRSAQIEFHCLKGSGNGRPEFVREDLGTGTYYFTWTTEHACGSGSSSSGSSTPMGGGSIFVLIIFVIIPAILLVYCLAGMLWNKSQGKSGLAMVPHINTVRSVVGCLPCCSSMGSHGLSIQAEEGKSQSLMDDDYE